MAMLNDSEQRRLSELEFRLQGEDPGFVRRFEENRRPRRRSHGLIALTGAAVAIAVAVIGLQMRAVAVVVIAQTALGATVGLWLTSRRRR
jgi:hypothetical protein